jgi:hypothetical protein
MKVKGEALVRKTQHLPVGITASGKSVVVLVQALPYGFTDWLDDILPEPPVPFDDFVRDKRRKIVYDDLNRPIPSYDYADPDYQARLRRVNRLQTVMMVREALSADEDISWDTDPENYDLPKDYEDYAEALEKELTEAFGWGAVGDIIRCSNALSGIDPERLERFEELFRSVIEHEGASGDNDAVSDVEGDGEVAP